MTSWVFKDDESFNEALDVCKEKLKCYEYCWIEENRQIFFYTPSNEEAFSKVFFPLQPSIPTPALK